jgi:alkylation response protein AidB-like acyl-CoA dehydrogenase
MQKPAPALDVAASSAALIERAAELAPLIRSEAAAGEENRCVPPAVVEAIGGAGFFRLAQPKRFGGLECDQPTIIRCLMQWSPADASTAWVAGLAIMHQWIIALFPPKAQEDIWADNPDAITFGSYAPSGTCERVAGGFRISGTWLYASGIDHGDWGLLGVLMPPVGEGPPAPGFVIVPKSDYRINATWDPMGLAATGSNDVICEQVFVPQHHAITFAELASGEAPGTQINTGPLYRYPLLSFIAYCIASPAVGCLEGALDQFIAQTGDWITRGAVVRGGAKVAEYQSVQMRVGAAAAALKAAQAMMYAQLDASHQTVMVEGGTLSVAERMDNRITQSYIIRLALEGLDELWGAVGGAGILKTEYIQRAWRDAHAVAHHVSFNWDALTAMYGQHLLGLEPQGQY